MTEHHVQSINKNLSQGLIYSKYFLRHLTNYLTLDENIILRTICKSFNTKLPMYHEYTLPDMNYWYGSLLDTEALWKCFKFTSSVHKIWLMIDWKDQAWGHTKGAIHLKLVRNNTIVTEKQNIFDVAEHTRTTMTRIFHKLNDIVENAQKNDQLQIWKYIGNGGGHELFIHQFRIIVQYR